MNPIPMPDDITLDPPCFCKALRWFSNLLDTFIIACSVAEYLVAAFGEAAAFSALSLIRIFRLLRILRVVRLIRVCPKLYRICISLVAAVRAVSWVFLLLFVFMCPCKKRLLPFRSVGISVPLAAPCSCRTRKTPWCASSSEASRHKLSSLVSCIRGIDFECGRWGAGGENFGAVFPSLYIHFVALVSAIFLKLWLLCQSNLKPFESRFVKV